MNTKPVSYIIKNIASFLHSVGWSVKSFEFDENNISYSLNFDGYKPFCSNSTKLLSSLNILLRSTNWSIVSNSSTPFHLNLTLSNVNNNTTKERITYANFKPCR